MTDPDPNSTQSSGLSAGHGPDRPLRRVILEMGTGNDLYGEDYTKAAIRAVHDAFRHSSISLFGSLGLDHRDMQVLVTVAVQKPELVDVDRVAAELPRGAASVTAVFGGLNIVDPDSGNITVIATAGIDARVPIPLDRYRPASTGRP